jgi:hypothetical protein
LLSFPAPLYTSGGSGALLRSARPTAQPAISRVEFYQDAVDVNFDGATFDAQLARYFVV